MIPGLKLQPYMVMFRLLFRREALDVGSIAIYDERSVTSLEITGNVHINGRWRMTTTAWLIFPVNV